MSSQANSGRAAATDTRSNQLWRRINPVVRLTVWYSLMLLVLSTLFSGIVYQLARNEIYNSAFPPKRGIEQIFIDNDHVLQARNRIYHDSMNRLMSNLVLFNLGVLTLGSGCSYFLAKRTLRPVKEALDSQTRFASDAAHELRTPLAVMKSEIEVELRHKSSAAALRALLESNLEEVNRLEEMTERLLLLSSEEIVENVTTFAASELFTEVVGKLQVNADKKSIALVFQPTDENVTGDRVSITSALTILVDNAIKYSPDNTTVKLSATKDNHGINLHVRDHGIGIKSDDLEHIFDRFYRADDSRSKLNVDGNGLGLSIASRIAKLHNGHIAVKSKPGKGSTFTLVLPG